jgi:hypothetical protein
MITGTNDRFPITFSLSIYRFLLAVYPKEFRQEYGADMLQVFRDCMLRAYGQDGAFGVFRLWALTLLDLVVSMVEEHLQKETKIMNKNTLIRLSGWALVLAGIGFISLFLNYYFYTNYPLMHIDNSFYSEFAYTYGNMVSPFLLSAGMLGLRALYSQSVGSTGKNILLLGALIGPPLTTLGSINPGTYDFWWYIYIGFALSMLCLALFGVIAVQRKPLPSGNSLPIVAGGIFPAILGISILINGSDFPFIVLALLIVQFLSMAAVGFILQGDVETQRTPMAAAAD